MRKLLIIPWFGPLPDWMPQYRENIQALQSVGYDVLFDHDLAGFKKRVQDRLGVECPITEGSNKIHDYRVTFGLLYEREIMPYDWWGHTDLDCVYGAVEKFFDPHLPGCDILTDGRNYLNGPWTLYRRASGAEIVFQQDPHWRTVLADPHTYGWGEGSVANLALKSMHVRISTTHRWDDPHLLSWGKDGGLFHDGDEISFYHFRYIKKWPDELT